MTFGASAAALTIFFATVCFAAATLATVAFVVMAADFVLTLEVVATELLALLVATFLEAGFACFTVMLKPPHE
ncbi:MAG TPA: hypothetical protein VFK88_10435 [Gallionella sp.]|nr:hypothetical protein [Gallionella sp.]